MPTDVIDAVIDAGMCIGCGSCAFARPDSFSIEMTLEGHFKARKSIGASKTVDPAICPMSGEGQDESVIAEGLYPDLPANGQIGRYLSTFACYVAEDDYRQRGGSGGLVTWLAAELLRQGKVDAVLHVKPVDPATNNGLIFTYGVSETVEDVRSGAKSRYYPVEMSQVLDLVRGTDKRFAVIGLPCFIKAIRLLQGQGLISSEQIPYCIGLVCGHLKSRHFANYLAWQKGGRPEKIAAFDFRYKIQGRKASDYGFSFVPSNDDGTLSGQYWPMRDVKGKNWGEGQFKNSACEYCEDVLAECADVVIGDAWLPGHVDDFEGTNVAVTRHKDIDTIIQAAAGRGAIHYTDISVSDVIRSQASGLRHRREGTAHRLERLRVVGKWIPRKRIKPKLAGSLLRRVIYDLRLAIATHSSAVFANVLSSNGSAQDYENRMKYYLKSYHFIIKGSNIAKSLAQKIRK
jgi:coenzyme F420 hydrogenase subunit beta